MPVKLVASAVVTMTLALGLLSALAPAHAQGVNTGLTANVGNPDIGTIRPLSNGLKQAICLAQNPTGKGCKGGERKPDPQPQPGGRRRG